MFQRAITRGCRFRTCRPATGVGLLGLAAIIAAIGCDGSWTSNADDHSALPTLAETISPDAAADDGQSPASESAEGDALAVTFRAGPGFCCNPLSIEFNAEVSDPTAGGGAVFEWNLGDDRHATGPTVHHTYNWAGEYQVVLEVRLSDGGTVTAEQTLRLGIDGQGGAEIDLSPTPAPPVPDDPDGTVVEVVADAGSDQEVASDEGVTLDGSASTGSGVEPLAFSWRQVGGPSVTLESPSNPVTAFTAPPGLEQLTALVFELTVSQGDASDSDRVVVTVSTTTPPVVVAHAGPDRSVESGDIVVLDGSGSSGTGADPLVFAWGQIQGPEVELEGPDAATTTFVAPVAPDGPLTLRFELTVVQGIEEDRDQVTVIVLPPDDNPDEPDDAQILEWMRALDPLPKVHYSYALRSDMLQDPANPMLVEYVRITRAVSLSGRAPRQHQVDAAVQVCKEINAGNPAIPASIAINYSPWHDIFPSDAPPTDFGPLHDAEIAEFQNRMLLFKGWLAEANERYDANIEMSALLFVCERFQIKHEDEEDYEEWNAAIDAKHDAFTLAGQEIFPEARIERFGRGAIQLCNDFSRWCPKELYTLRELGDTFNCSLYVVPMVDEMVETFRRTHELAVMHGVSEIMPRVALAAGWRQTGPYSREWDMDWDYDTSYSWQLGAQINDPWYGDHPGEHAPWHAAAVVSFYPKPFDSRIPSWGKHFIAYVRGAHGIEDLP